MNEFFQRIKDLTDLSYAKGDDVEKVMLSTGEEFGEVATCVAVDLGHKNKILEEPTTNECVDLAICALSIFFLSGGKLEDIVAIGNKKLTKWEEQLFQPNADGLYFNFNIDKVPENIREIYRERIEDIVRKNKDKKLSNIISKIVIDPDKPSLRTMFLKAKAAIKNIVATGVQH